MLPFHTIDKLKVNIGLMYHMYLPQGVSLEDDNGTDWVQRVRYVCRQRVNVPYNVYIKG